MHIKLGLTDEVKRMLKMPSSKRSDENIKAICACLVEVVPEFMDFPNHIQKSLAKVGMLQEFEMGRVIIRQNHKADNFYFIISGISK